MQQKKFIRDNSSGAVINTDVDEYNRKKAKSQYTKDYRKLKQEVQYLTKELIELKQILENNMSDTEKDKNRLNV